MRQLGLAWFAVLSLALLASCSKTDPGTETGTGGVGGTASGCPSETRFYCVSSNDGVCSDALFPAVCTSGHWACESGMIPESECQCFVAVPGPFCPDGGAGAGGRGGEGGRGGTAGGSGGAGTCGDKLCGTGEVCVRRQTLGGACFLADGGCPPGRSLSGQCCVADPVYSCAPHPSACVSSLTCACAAPALCSAGQTCTMPSVNEIDCTLLAP